MTDLLARAVRRRDECYPVVDDSALVRIVVAVNIARATQELDNELGYMERCLRNAAVDAIRRQQVERNRVLREELAEHDRCVAAVWAGRRERAKRAFWTEVQEHVVMPARVADQESAVLSGQLVWCWLFEGRTHREMADEQGLRRDAVMARVSRMRKALLERTGCEDLRLLLKDSQWGRHRRANR